MKKNDMTTPIDRHAVVSRHPIDWPDLLGQIPLGNGNFAFNADGTGLQTFGGNTMSHWCWHSFPLPEGARQEDVKPWAAVEKGRLKGAGTYPLFDDWHAQHRFQRENGYGVTTPPPLLKDWLSFNPHPLNLGRLGFVDADGQRLAVDECVSLSHRLDVWTGLLTSRFSYKGEIVTVKTCVGFAVDIVAVRIASPLLRTGALRVRLDFPSPSNPGGPGTPLRALVGFDDKSQVNSPDPRCKLKWDPNTSGNPVPWVGDFANPAGHRTEIAARTADRLDLCRTIDATTYYVTLAGPGVGGSAKPASPSDEMPSHCIDVGPFDTESLELSCLYSGKHPTGSGIPAFDEIRTACAKSWEAFWNSGGAMDLSGSQDPRWFELERRIVLSQYELAVHSAGDQFPAEVGLTGYDGWSAKFHLEMTWLHIAHFALWGRWPMTAKALRYYERNAPLARAIAANFDYQGLMWPKFTGPAAIHDGYPEGMALMWRQPHPIFFAELEYRLSPTQATLDKWKDIVLGTAEFIADYPMLDEKTGTYALDPVWPNCERGIAKNTIFELGYWRWGLVTAQQWRERLGLAREKRWDLIVERLAPLPVQDGLYVYCADWPDTYTRRCFDHIDPIALFGFLPPVPGFDRDIAHRTLLEFARDWNWEEVWGWDFPLMAMGAARMGEPGIAVDALLNPSRRNRCDERGICLGPGIPYFPTNGGLLYAIAMMAAGWDGAPKRHAPGFPDDGSWTVRWEGLNPAP